MRKKSTITQSIKLSTKGRVNKNNGTTEKERNLIPYFSVVVLFKVIEKCKNLYFGTEKLPSKF